MSKDNSKKEPHQRCNACDFQKLKQVENNPDVRKLRDKIEQLNFRLTECRNENQMLKRNLQLAKKMVYQEVGGNDLDFQALMKHGTECGWKGRQEDVLVLKTKVQELKDHLKLLEGDQLPPQETPSEEYVKHFMPTDRKRLWRMELERRLARENAEKDINPLVQECLELRRSLDSEKSRFKELNEEVKLLRAELQSQVEKNEEDVGIVNSFKTLESQLQQTLAERAEIRGELEGSRFRNKKLTEETDSLKKELELFQKKTGDSNALIDSLTSTHKSIQEAIDAEKMIVQQNIERYQEELKALQENLGTDLEILDHLQCIVHEKNELVDELKTDVDFEKDKKEPINKKDSKSSSLSKLLPKDSKSLQPKMSQEVSSPAVEDETGNRESVQKERQLRLECAKYRILYEAAKMERERLPHLIVMQESKMNEVAVQVVETGRLILQKNAEKKDLLERTNQLQRSLAVKRRRGKLHLPSKSRLDELRIKSDAQRQENDFLRNFLRTAVCNKAKDLQLFKSFIDDTKRFLQTSLGEIKESLKANPSGRPSNRLSLESVNENGN